MKSEKISSIRKCEKRLIKLYTELFGETDVLLSSLQKNIAEAVKKSEDSFVRGPGQKKLTGKRKARIAAAFVRDLAQSNLWVYGKQLDSSIKAAALAAINYRYASNVSIKKLTKDWAEEHTG